MATGGADTLANELFNSLVGDEDFDINLPDFSNSQYALPLPTTTGLYAPVAALKNEDLTTKTIGGSGTFDYFMDAFKAHLKGEFDGGRITGEQYTKAYIALTEGAMGNATQFLLGRDASYWGAVQAQLQARQSEVALVITRVQLEAEKTKLQTLRFEALSAQSTYALNKLRLATESVGFDTAKFQLDQMLPLQKSALQKQIEQVTAEIAGLTIRNKLTEEQTIAAKLDNELYPFRKQMLEKQIAQQIAETMNVSKQGVLLDNEAAMQPQKVDMLAKQILGVTAQNILTGKQSENMQQEINLGADKLALLKKQVANQEAQTQNITKQGALLDKELALHPLKENLLREQGEAQRAQTMDNRSDGTPITGSMGQQKLLYGQQIISYKRDAEMKAARVFIDAWVTMKTIDEGLAPPTQFSNTNLDQVLSTLKANNGFN